MENFTKYIADAGLSNNAYQYEGVKWCLSRELDGKGGFLADEMGLGKTITMIGLFVANSLARTLIVLPPILIPQWHDQMEGTYGSLPLNAARSYAPEAQNPPLREQGVAGGRQPPAVVVYHGANKKRVSMLELQEARVVIVSYDTISVCKKRPELCDIHRIEWSRVVFDEAHHLRNKKTSRYNGASLLKSDIHWMVSGTIIQNGLSDLKNLCSLIGIPKTKDLQSLSKTHILRRTKQSVGINIPGIKTHTHIVKWSNYLEYQVSEELHSYLGMCAKRSGETYFPGEDDPKKRLLLFMKARQACCYPKMLNKRREAGGGSPPATPCSCEGANECVAFEQGLATRSSCPLLDASSKLDCVVDTILQNKDNGNGKLIFCNFNAEIAEIKSRLVLGGMVDVAVLNGETTKRERADILSTQNDAIILQIQTGCEGLNLQEFYSEVYFVSPHWNPAIEDQAVARCHRIGQKKEVVVHRFQMEGASYTDISAFGASVGSPTMGEFSENYSGSMDNYVIRVQERKRDFYKIVGEPTTPLLPLNA